MNFVSWNLKLGFCGEASKGSVVCKYLVNWWMRLYGFLPTYQGNMYSKSIKDNAVRVVESWFKD